MIYSRIAGPPKKKDGPRAEPQVVRFHASRDGDHHARRARRELRHVDEHDAPTADRCLVRPQPSGQREVAQPRRTRKGSYLNRVRLFICYN